MSTHKTVSRGFRFWEENAKRLEWATQLGLNASEIVNEVLSNHLRSALEKAKEKKAKELKQVLAATVP
jgi:hypothetical protein